MNTPIKKLDLKRETVKSLGVRSSVRTGRGLPDATIIIAATLGGGVKIDEGTDKASFVGGGRTSPGPKGGPSGGFGDIAISGD